MPIQILGGIRPTTRNRAVGDILAGVTLASMNVPQVLGYIRMACTPRLRFL
jgi:SulP family sulfate permease